MADKIKEFVNKTFTGADFDVNLQAPLITTGADTQAVIKDVYAGTMSVKSDLYVNAFKIEQTDNLSGNEIVDVNSTCSIKLTDTYDIGMDGQYELLFATNASSVIANIKEISTVETNLTTTYNTGAVVYSGLTGISISDARCKIFKNANNIWFAIKDDGNATQVFYKSTDGLAYTAYTLPSFGSYTPWCLDGEHTLYYAVDTTLYKVDLSTDTPTATIVGTFSASIGVSSYPWIRFANGFAFGSNNNSVTSAYYIDTANPTTKGVITGIWARNSALPVNVAHYDGHYYFLSTGGGTDGLQSAKIQTLTNNAIATQLARINTLTLAITIYSPLIVVGKKAIVSTGYTTASRLYEIDYTDMSYRDLGTHPATQYSCVGVIRNVTTTTADYKISIPLRITGVETTL